MTKHFSDGSYAVTRCDKDGGVQQMQVVGPIRVPGGGNVMVPVAGFRQVDGLLAGSISTYGDPDDPAWAQVWREHGDEVRAMVIPPTKEPVE